MFADISSPSAQKICRIRQTQPGMVPSSLNAPQTKCPQLESLLIATFFPSSEYPESGSPIAPCWIPSLLGSGPILLRVPIRLLGSLESTPDKGSPWNYSPRRMTLEAGDPSASQSTQNCPSFPCVRFRAEHSVVLYYLFAASYLARALSFPFPKRKQR